MGIDIIKDAYNKHYSKLVEYARKMIIDKHLAEDIVSDCFAQLIKRQAHFNNSTHLTKYLLTMVSNGALKIVMEKRVKSNAPFPEIVEEFMEYGEVLPDRLAIIRTMSENLPKKEKEVLALHLFHGFSYSEIAGKINMSEGNVRVYMHKAKMKIQQQLNQGKGLSASLKRKEPLIQITQINAELIKYLASHPSKMYELSPHKFEELVAALLKDMGYEVQLNPETRDGGRDILAVITIPPNKKILTIVECKRYNSNYKIGIDIVERFIYTIKEKDNANAGLIATTSFFSADAKKLQDKYKWLLNLNDFNEVKGWLGNYGQWSQTKGTSGLWLPDTPIA